MSVGFVGPPFTIICDSNAGGGGCEPCVVFRYRTAVQPWGQLSWGVWHGSVWMWVCGWVDHTLEREGRFAWVLMKGGMGGFLDAQRVNE